MTQSRRNILTSSVNIYNRKILDMRSFLRLLQSEDFEITALNCSDEEFDNLKKVIHEGVLKDLKLWVGKNRLSDTDSLSYRQLRLRAKHHNIHRWSRLDRHELQEALREVQLQTSQEST